jgi:hypothetical protein
MGSVRALSDSDGGKEREGRGEERKQEVLGRTNRLLSFDTSPNFSVHH